MQLICDVDEVLLRWLDGYRAYVISKGYKVFGQYPKEWEFDGWIEGDWRSLIWDFNKSDFFHHLLPYDDAVPCLRFLHQNKWKIRCLSSCSDHATTVSNRILNLNNYFGEIFDEVTCLAPGEKKRDILCYLPKSVWVEDNFENAIDGAECGHTTFLMSRPYNENRNHESLVRVKDWQEIVRKLGYEF